LLGCRLRRSLRTARNVSVRSTHVIPVSMAAQRDECKIQIRA
jgi:hypothetical protein